ncbi:MAG: NAD-dependent protein deacylase [Lactobacillus sp.]|jgi:NAD-dependent deacetylase|nr:NAD-dependent protein deacylase [Lactobacillus sp.]MCH3905730.1 NAD-dependent protein deacylase [Lactobacillus sp.]MCH3990701.1 NAD-dependent protein deacylase [Lactobacillus sp.]MCH4068583.1 NAD-dependent protein deacylase [Lactobacillus sp.]MCI1304122.1 NAD-dependent protein deacylase [Lactobacillus sp.]
MNEQMQMQANALQVDLKQAKHVVFLTGAGVSTHSGIPDYRSKNGIYHGIATPPEKILSTSYLLQQPEQFYDFVQQNMYFPAAQPNPIHTWIANICNQHGWLITQNVDGLDKKADNQHVIEFHGDLYDLYCTKCGQMFSYEVYKNSFRHAKDNGIIRPGIVLYGEPIDQTKLSQSVQKVAEADLIIICGTSFVVYPFAGLLAYASPQAKIWAINKTPLPATNKVKQVVTDALDFIKLVSQTE